MNAFIHLIASFLSIIITRLFTIRKRATGVLRQPTKKQIVKMGSLDPGKKVWILGDAFDKVMPHHESIKALWESKWKFPV
jgi:hypothetical protein